MTSVINAREVDNEFARPAIDKSAANERLRVAGETVDHGLGTQLETTVVIAVNGATRFTARVGVDDATPTNDPVFFEIQVDGTSVWRSAQLHKGDRSVAVDVALTGKKELRLLTRDVGVGLSQAYADWLDAKFEFDGTAPKSVAPSPYSEAPYILSPKPARTPRINSPRVFGARPGHPFLFTLAATGERPLTFAAEGLPEGLALDSKTGRITGTVAKPGTYSTIVRATNTLGTAEQKLRIEIGERISLTPALGWNSWNCWAAAVDQDKILRSARAMASSGLIDHGWSYINIDDTWQGARSGPLNALQPNEKFPDIKQLAETVHGLGLRLGIYSTPWVTSYASHAGGSSEDVSGKWSKPSGPKTVNRKMLPWAIGKYSFASADAKQWADWGIDYLKYDWFPNEVPETAEMLSALRTSGRDIVYSLSNATPFDTIRDISHLSNSWRTTGDIRDAWGSMLRIGLAQEKWRTFAGPGHWNDPDMLVVGHVGWGPKLHPSHLTPSEQYTHLTLWSLLSAPLLIGCDLEQLDEFTLNLLTNDEVLEVDQDPRGEQAAQIVGGSRIQVWAKTLEDGSHAVGLFNFSDTAQTVSVTWTQLGLNGPQQVRDLWRQEDRGVQPTGYGVEVPRHGAALIRVRPAAK